MRFRKSFKLALSFFFFYILTNQFLFAQAMRDKKPEILICGTIHQIPDSVSQNWNEYRKFLRDFRPDAICTEYRMPGDSVSLMQADGQRYQQIADSLTKVWNADTLHTDKRVKELYAALRQNDDWEKRIELFQLLYLGADFGNANFQAWRAHKLVSLLPEDKKKEIRLRYPAYKRIESIVNGIKNNEYSNIVFPLAVEFSIDYLYPVDDRTYNMRFSIAYMEAYSELEGTKFENKAKLFWEEFNKTESGEIAKGNALMFVNSAAWQKKSDYAQTGLYLSSGNRHHKDYVNYWNERNKKVGINILDQIKGKEHKRVLVFMGYLHIPNMKKYMIKEKNIILKTISDYQTVSNPRNNKDQTAEEIIQTSLNAVGTKANRASIQNLESLADCVSPGGKYKTEIHTASGGYSYFKQVYSYKPGIFEAVIENKKDGYMLGDTITTLGSETIYVIRSHEFQNIVLEPDQRFHSFEKPEKVDVGGTTLYRIKAKNELNDNCTLFFDAKTKLLAALHSNNPGNKNEVIKTKFSAWKKVGSLYLPWQVDIDQGGKMYQFNYSQIIFNDPRFKKKERK